uniref:Protein MCM10 homolog n=1 Tax=Strigamia maritima TaxID=126957 RepID=T1IJL1_STRMM
MDEDLDFDSILAELDMDEIVKDKDSEMQLEESKKPNNNVNKDGPVVSSSLEEELKAMKARVAELELQAMKARVAELERQLGSQQQEQKTTAKNKVLTDVDLFNNASITEPSAIEQNLETKLNSSKEKALKLSLFGEDSSDEETEKYPLESKGLNDYGKFVKSRLSDSIKTSPKKCVQVEQKSTKPTNKSDANFEKEFYSGLRIINPLVSSAMMKEKMEGRRLIRISQIQNFLRGGDIDGDWVTIGVIISKSDPKTSSKGKTFSIWRMSDLRDCSKVVSFFLFGNVHKTHWKIPIGSVVGILNAGPMSNKDNASSKYADELSFVIDHQDKAMILGRSRDFGTCLGRKKDGGKCSAVVNKDVCDFCPFHIQSAYKKMSLKRTDLNVSYSGPEPKSLKKKLLQNQEIFYGGQSFTSSPLVKTKKGLNLESLRLQRDAKNMQNEFKQIKIKGKHLTQSELNVVSGISSQSEPFGEMMSAPTAGSRNLMKHILCDKPSTQSANFKSVTASDLLKIHKSEFEAKNNIPRLSSAVSIPLEFFPKKLPRMTRVEVAKLRASQIVKNKGTIRKADPNAIKKVISPNFMEKVKDNLDEKSSENTDLVENQPAKRICLKNDEFERVLNAKSIHSDSLASEENEKYFNEMETKEKIETQATSITQLACKVVSCKQCNYTAFSASELCKSENHPLKFHSAMKRFFSCKSCKRRIVSINKFPTAPCANCGEKSFEKTGMKRERTGPKLANEQLSIRGDETKFLNSLNTKGLNINV